MITTITIGVLILIGYYLTYRARDEFQYFNGVLMMVVTMSMMAAHIFFLFKQSYDYEKVSRMEDGEDRTEMVERLKRGNESVFFG